jgi:hypothetical protein
LPIPIAGSKGTFDAIRLCRGWAARENALTRAYLAALPAGPLYRAAAGALRFRADQPAEKGRAAVFPPAQQRPR